MGIESWIQDIRFALRILRRRPLFSIVAVFTLGLGIGAATAMFSVVDGVLLKPLPYEEPGRLMAIWETRPDNEGRPGDEGVRWDRSRLSYPQYRDLSEKSTLFDGLAAYNARPENVATLTGVGRPVDLRAGAATFSLLPLLGVRPTLGRWFLPVEEASRVLKPEGNGGDIAVARDDGDRHGAGASRWREDAAESARREHGQVLEGAPVHPGCHEVAESASAQGDDGAAIDGSPRRIQRVESRRARRL